MFQNIVSKVINVFVIFGFTANSVLAEKAAENLYQDIPKELMPQKAISGEYSIGVKTLNVSLANRFDFKTQSFSERPLTIELWYPAKNTSGKAATYQDVTRTHQPFYLQGQAFRNAKVLKQPSKKYPLVVLSHGYTGYRTIMFYLAEHLASHGYVVAAIDHRDSTNQEIDIVNGPFNGFPSTLMHRSRDQYGVLEEMLSDTFAKKYSIDQTRAAVVGYSMGAYGALNTIGGCYQFTEGHVARFTGVQDPKVQAQLMHMMNSCAGGGKKVLPAIKAAVAMAPWGQQYQLFSSDSLAKIKVPTLIVSGDQDDISHYPSIRNIFAAFKNADAYLLSYLDARHNIATHPAPQNSRINAIDIEHYWEPVWDAQQLNSINKHFILAHFNCHVKASSDDCSLLKLNEYATPEMALNTNGIELKNTWVGFPQRFSMGMRWESNRQ